MGSRSGVGASPSLCVRTKSSSARRRQRVAADVDLTRLLGPVRTKLRVYLAVFGPQRATSLHRWLLLNHHLQGLRQKKERERGDTLDKTVPPETSEWRSRGQSLRATETQSNENNNKERPLSERHIQVWFEAQMQNKSSPEQVPSGRPDRKRIFRQHDKMAGTRAKRRGGPDSAYQATPPSSRLQF